MADGKEWIPFTSHDMSIASELWWGKTTNPYKDNNEKLRQQNGRVWTCLRLLTWHSSSSSVISFSPPVSLRVRCYVQHKRCMHKLFSFFTKLSDVVIVWSCRFMNADIGNPQPDVQGMLVEPSMSHFNNTWCCNAGADSIVRYITVQYGIYCTEPYGIVQYCVVNYYTV